MFDFFKKKKKKTVEQVSSDTSVEVGEEMDHYFLTENDLPKNFVYPVSFVNLI